MNLISSSSCSIMTPSETIRKYLEIYKYLKNEHWFIPDDRWYRKEIDGNTYAMPLVGAFLVHHNHKSPEEGEDIDLKKELTQEDHMICWFLSLIGEGYLYNASATSPWQKRMLATLESIGWPEIDVSKDLTSDQYIMDIEKIIDLLENLGL